LPNFAEYEYAWWLLWNSSPPMKTPSGMMLQRGVLRLEIAVTEIMADAVDHAGGPERDPEHLRDVDREAWQAEHREVDEQREQHAEHAVAGVDVPLEPVVRRAAPVDSTVSASLAEV
jgi:hypothetical protein